MAFQEQIENKMRYHAPTPEKRVRHEAVQDAALAFALVIAANTDQSDEQKLALERVIEAKLWANAAIAYGPDRADGDKASPQA